MKRTEGIYEILVNRVPGIRSRYHKFRDQLSGTARISAWGYLLKLNMQYYVLHDKNLAIPAEMYPDRERHLDAADAESAKYIKLSPQMLAKKLSAYDVISFDVFDTLIFRPFEKPTDAFYFVGDLLEYPDFTRIRCEIEKKAREKKYEAEGHYEVNFDEIWQLMHEETGIPADDGIRAEWEIEQKYCFANPYFIKVIQELKKYNKPIIITSDMYLGKEKIKKLLEMNGYPDFNEYFISCDYKKSKSEGSLYNVVRQKYGNDKNYIHVGDNKISDYKHAADHRFQSILYDNMNHLGHSFRAEDMSKITGSIYRGIVNTHLYNGLETYSKTYEFGFIYGGLFAVGYCQWIHERVKKLNADKILFLSRDGDILKKVYTKMYPEDSMNCCYVYWSRIAAAKITADYYKYDYFRRFLYHKVNQEYTLEQVFKSMDIGDMLDSFLTDQSNTNIWKRTSILIPKAADDIRWYLNKNWKQVMEHYEEQIDAGGKYYRDILNGCKRAVAVDVGWAGSGAIALNYAVNHLWHLDCKIIGLVAGTNSIHNEEPNASESFLYCGQLQSYMFSQTDNRNIWKFHNPSKNHNVVVELLLASPEKSFRGFSKGLDKYIFSEKTDEIDSVEVQRGILDFAQLYLERIGKEHMIQGADAYAPIALVLNNMSWLKDVIDNDKFTMNLE